MRWPSNPLLIALTLSACGTDGVDRAPTVRSSLSARVSDAVVKVGRPYSVGGRRFVPADEPGLTQEGLASWYGSEFEGRPTASGEPFHADWITAAHPTLPLPSYVRVTNRANGRSALVRVNDRGPFVEGRVIDLSRGAATLIGLTHLSPVRVERVEPAEADRRRLRSGRPASGGDAPRQSADTQIRQPPASNGRWTLQVAAFASRDRALALATAVGGRVEAAGLVQRVRVGRFDDRGQALAALARLRARGYGDTRLVVEP